MGKVVGKYTVDPSIDPTLNFVCLVGDFLQILPHGGHHH